MHDENTTDAQRAVEERERLREARDERVERYRNKDFVPTEQDESPVRLNMESRSWVEIPTTDAGVLKLTPRADGSVEITGSTFGEAIVRLAQLEDAVRLLPDVPHCEAGSVPVPAQTPQEPVTRQVGGGLGESLPPVPVEPEDTAESDFDF